MISSLSHAGQLLIDNLDKIDVVSPKLKSLTDRYNKVSVLCNERQELLRKILPLVRDQVNHIKVIEDVIAQVEPVLKAVKPIGIEPQKAIELAHDIKVVFLVSFIL